MAGASSVDDAKLRVPLKDPSAPARLRVLSLGGGGYRGLFTARVLSLLESRFPGAPLQERFDVFAGTSIGGLLAAGLAAGIPARELYATFKSHGPRVFPKRRFSALRQLVAPSFASAPLAAAINDCLGDFARAPIRSSTKGLVITAVDWVAGAPKIYRSGGTGAKNASDETLLDVCLATSAAPTFFPPHFINGAPMLDGGLVANNPDGVVFFEALSRWPNSLLDLEILSIGTAGVAAGGMAGAVPTSLAGWAYPMVSFVIGAQERLVAEQVSTLLGPRYLRINHIPGPQQKALAKMTVVDASMTGTLESLADLAVGSAVTHQLPQLTRFFS